LSLYTQHPSWCSTHERSFRLFAADGTEKRLRFKPIPSSQRAFLHALAEDFGLDSESVDPEPHRHVVVFKSPRFVSAPMKTLAQCVKIRQSSSQEAVALPKPSNVLEAYNAIILSNPRFALTAEELRGELSAELKKAESAGKAFAIDFLPSEEVVIHSAPGTNPVDENGLKALKPLVVKTVLAKKLAESVALCRVDHSLNVMRREDEMDASDGWSQVVKGAPFMAAPRGPGIGGKSAFTVLGGLRKKREDEEKMKEKERARAREKEKEKEKEKEDVVENWESAMEGWEET
jgi:transcriptional repressor NF-X1